jgi:hypothetical protein
MTRARRVVAIALACALALVSSGNAVRAEVDGQQLEGAARRIAEAGKRLMPCNLM